MTNDPSPADLSFDRAGPGDLIEVFGWLDREPVVNVYLAALVLRDGLAAALDEYWLARRDGRLCGLLYLGARSGAVLPVGDDPEAMARLAGVLAGRLATLPGRFQVIGPRAAVAAAVERLGGAGLQPRLDRPQTYMGLRRADLPPFERLPGLRAARPEDHDLVFTSGAELRLEELGEDPRLADPVAYARRVQEECAEGYTYLWLERGELRFRASLSALTADAVQVSGVYTPPAWRNQGCARRGMSELCARLFGRTRSVCLFVNDDNAPALAVYRRLGFEDLAPWASAFYAS